MNNRSKNKIRNASNSRENRSNLGSTSKQKITITKYKSQKNLFLKQKPSNPLQKRSKQHSKNTSRSQYQNQSKQQKPTKQQPSEEYYNHEKKTKNKNKLYGHEEIEKQKKSYFQSLYMHKEDQQEERDNHQKEKEDTSININFYNKNQKHEKLNDNNSPLMNSNLKMIKKIKLIQRHAAIDCNGKFVQNNQNLKQIKHKKNDSQQHTFSVFQNTKNSIPANIQAKKNSQNIKIKKDNKLKTIKTKTSELYQAELIVHNKSVMKSVMKLMKHTSGEKTHKDLKDLKDLKQQNPLAKKHPHYTQTTKHPISRQPIIRIPTSSETIHTSSTKTIQSLQTQSSPQFICKNPNFLSSLSTSLISYQQIIQQIQQQKQNLKILRQTITNPQYLHERINSIDFLGKICHLMSIKRQSHSLAVIYLDNYVEHVIMLQMKDKEKRKLFKLNQETINFNELVKSLKLYAITCLLLALKMDDGLMARKLCFQLNTNLENLLKSSQSKINQKMKQSIAHLHGYTSTSTSTNKHSRKESVYSLSKSKTNITSLSSTKNIIAPDDLNNKESRKLLAHQKQTLTKDTSYNTTNNIDMPSIMKVQTDILTKFKFKLNAKSPQYWIDVMTFLWDDYINMQVSWEQMLYFRESQNRTNISYLLQLLEKTFLSLQVYQFPTFTIVLATMYLIIRMKLQEQKQCQTQKSLYEKYRLNLLKSTNIIFYDNIGINELYGDFLTQMNLSLSDIVSAVKYVGQFLTYETMKVFSFGNRTKQVNNKFSEHEHRLSLYQYNAEIYAAGWK